MLEDVPPENTLGQSAGREDDKSLGRERRKGGIPKNCSFEPQVFYHALHPLNDTTLFKPLYDYDEDLITSRQDFAPYKNH